MGSNIQTDSAAYSHMDLVPRRGIANYEKLDLNVLSKANAYEFLFTCLLLKLTGATGSPGNPTAALVNRTFIPGPHANRLRFCCDP